MEIIVSKIHDKYAFSAGELLDGKFCTYFSSINDSYLVPGLKDAYDFAGEADYAAKKTASVFPSFILAKKAQMEARDVGMSAKDAVIQHFSVLLNILNERFINSRHEANDQNDFGNILKAINSEIDMAVAGINNILKDLDEDRKYLIKLRGRFKILKKKVEKLMKPDEDVKLASNTQELPPLDKQDIIMFFVEKILRALTFSDPTVFIEEVTKCKDDNGDDLFVVSVGNKDGGFINVNFNNDLLMCAIMPVNIDKLKMSDKNFIDKIFEPIIREVGHYYDTSRNIVVVPNLNNDSRYSWGGFEADSMKPVTYSLDFKSTDTSTSCSTKLAFSDTQNKKGANIEEGPMDNALGREVKFINPEIESLFGRTGTIVDYDAGGELIIFDVDFRRGLGIVSVKQEDVSFLE